MAEWPTPNRVRGLDVVVGIEQDGRGTRRSGDLAEYRGMGTLHLEYLHPAKPGSPKQVGGRLGGPAHLRCVEVRCAHRGDAHQGL